MCNSLKWKEVRAALAELQEQKAPPWPWNRVTLSLNRRRNGRRSSVGQADSAEGPLRAVRDRERCEATIIPRSLGSSVANRRAMRGVVLCRQSVILEAGASEEVLDFAPRGGGL